MFELVPDEELESLYDALRDHCCVACYRPVTNECGGEHEFYCHNCDEECAPASTRPAGK